MGPLSLALFALLALNGCQALQWAAKPANGSTIHGCVGSSVTLPWSYKLNTGDRVNASQWFFGSQRIALTSEDKFYLTKFGSTKNLRPEDNKSGMRINNISLNDAGEYRLEIEGEVKSKGAHFSTKKMFNLDVSEKLETIRIAQNLLAVRDKANHRWVFELVCGNFQSKDKPSFDVQWRLPGGKVHHSTGYRNGKFYLWLPMSIKGGKFTCFLPKTTPGMCLSRDLQSTVTVKSWDGKAAINKALQREEQIKKTGKKLE